jgi:cystathionine beta-lyase/cystathionine gamma-synthase
MGKEKVNSARMPVYRDSGFDLTDAVKAAAAFEKETSNLRVPETYIYSRYRNPTVVASEEEMMKLEGSNWSLLTQTGMSAIDTALSVFQEGSNTKPWLFFNEIYGGTISYVENILKRRRGIETHYFSPVNGSYSIGDLETAIKQIKPGIVYVETVSNPLVIVVDVNDVAAIAHKYGAKVIVDNTFATPWLFKPLENGADLVIHSATKYFSGHGNLTAGVLSGNDENIGWRAVEYRKFVGHMISPDDAYRLQTQVKTFHLRFPRQCENAVALASMLHESDHIERVFYPGLPSHPTYLTAKKMFKDKGFGAIVTFDIAGKNKKEKQERRDRFISHVREKIKLIPTLGDPETIMLPVEPVWGAKYPEPGMIRLSLGFEDYDEVMETVQSALEKL